MAQTLQDKAETCLFSGDYETALSMLYRLIKKSRDDDFCVFHHLAGYVLLLMEEYTAAQVILEDAMKKSFATTSIHRNSMGWRYWFDGSMSRGVEWFWRAGKAGYTNDEWQMSLHFAQIREPDLVQRKSVDDCLTARLSKCLHENCDSLRLRFALGDMSVTQFENSIREMVSSSFDTRQAEAQVRMHFWVGLDHFRNGDEASGIERLQMASRPGKACIFITGEMVLARLELQRLGIDPITGGEYRKPFHHSPEVEMILNELAEASPEAKATTQDVRVSDVNQMSQVAKPNRRSSKSRKQRSQQATPGSDLGGFFNLFGAIGPKTPFLKALRRAAMKRKARLVAVPEEQASVDSGLVIGSTRDRQCAVLPPGLSDVDALARELSREIAGPIVHCHIHDGDFWMYSLFSKGKHVDTYRPLPDYFPREEGQPRSRLKGNAKELACVWPDVKAAQIGRYFRFWDRLPDENAKAHPTDHYGYNDCRQLVDFLARLRLWIPTITPAPAGSSEVTWNWLPK